MDLNGILKMISNIFVRKAVNAGINKGINLAAGKGKPEAQMTAAERSTANKARETAKLARKAARVTRRMGR
jgi:hypothetical protein